MNIGISIILLGFLGIIGINSKDILTTIWVSPTKLIKQLSLILSIITLYIVLYWWYIYETNTNNYQLVSNIHIDCENSSHWESRSIQILHLRVFKPVAHTVLGA